MIKPDIYTDNALIAIRVERERQASKDRPFDCADPKTKHVVSLAVLMKEVGEVAREIIEGNHCGNLRNELVQVAAVACAMIEAQDRERPGDCEREALTAALVKLACPCKTCRASAQP